MARIEGLIRGGSLLVRLIFLLSRRSYGRVILPARVYALDPGLLFTIALMEEGREHAKQGERRPRRESTWAGDQVEHNVYSLRIPWDRASQKWFVRAW